MLQKQFAHTLAIKVDDLLKSFGFLALTPETFRRLECISSKCKSCQKIGTVPKRYRVRIKADNTHFKAKVHIDFMYIEESSVLQMPDNATNFSEAQFVDPLTTKSF